MIDSFALADGFALNPDAGVLMPLDARSGERLGLSAANLLDETNAQGMKPLAVFNRFDLAPADWIHCGEHRIVYGKENPDSSTNRFLLIFEAAVPNPESGGGRGGMPADHRVLGGLSAPRRRRHRAGEEARRLLLRGQDGPEPAAPDLPSAVVDYKNYGGDGSRGQVRGNLFMQQPWQLREWLTQPTFDPANPLAFVVETVKDNPLAELYRDNLSRYPDRRREHARGAHRAPRRFRRGADLRHPGPPDGGGDAEAPGPGRGSRRASISEPARRTRWTRRRFF